VVEHEEAVLRAHDGQFGVAGEIIRTRGAAPESVFGLSIADATRLDPGTRDDWEARLAPWRQAVCISNTDLPAALRALVKMPGSIGPASDIPN
jgi:hypothetical protein